MSDTVFEIATTFTDVAELGQGYINRADGERILVPLNAPCEIGEGVRFIVHLGDGTPAFAGAGRCVQSSDQGPGAGEERYETLLDSLAFDERSRPVYDYIVAVRQAVYAAGGPEAQAQAGAEEEAQSVDADAAMEEATTFEASYEETVEPTVNDEPAPSEAELEADSAGAELHAGGFEAEEAPAAVSGEVARLAASAPPPASMPPASMPPASMPPASIRPAEPAYVPYEPPPPPPEADPSTYVIAAVSRGMLQRPAIAAHWQPATPQPPRPSRSTGLFRYPPGNLPVPSRPPRPDLDPSLYVQPAAGPSPSIRP